MRTKIGIITSAKMQKTVAVTVHRYVMHPMYGKRFRVSKKFLADTNGQEVGLGDEVEISECRPLSKRKCFKVTDVRKRAPKLADLKMEEVEQKTKRDHRDSLAEKKHKEVPQSKS
jgi:small subunit ribosomal protein S17